MVASFLVFLIGWRFVTLFRWAFVLLCISLTTIRDREPAPADMNATNPATSLWINGWGASLSNCEIQSLSFDFVCIMWKLTLPFLEERFDISRDCLDASWADQTRISCSDELSNRVHMTILIDEWRQHVHCKYTYASDQRGSIWSPSYRISRMRWWCHASSDQHRLESMAGKQEMDLSTLRAPFNAHWELKWSTYEIGVACSVQRGSGNVSCDVGYRPNQHHEDRHGWSPIHRVREASSGSNHSKYFLDHSRSRWRLTDRGANSYDFNWGIRCSLLPWSSSTLSSLPSEDSILQTGHIRLRVNTKEWAKVARASLCMILQLRRIIL